MYQLRKNCDIMYRNEKIVALKGNLKWLESFSRITNFITELIGHFFQKEQMFYI